MLELFGKEYIIDHILNVTKKQAKDETYRMYVTEALKCIVMNTSGQGSTLTLNKSFSELVNPSTNTLSDEEKEKNSEEKAREIINNIKQKLGGVTR